MSEPTPSQESAIVAAVLAQRLREDRAELMDELVALLLEVVPGAEVKRSLLRRQVRSVRVPLGDRAYLLERSSGGFEARRQQVVRGVVIRNDPLELDLFLTELGAALDAELRRTERGRQALAAWLKAP